MTLLESSAINVAEIVARYRHRADLNLIFDFQLGVYHRLDNDVASELFAYAKSGLTFEEVVARVASEYDVPEDIVRSDAYEFFRSIDKAHTEEIPTDWYTIDKGFDEPLRFPLRMEIELTSMCNWNCGFCYNVWKIDPNLTDREIRQQIKQFPAKHIPKELAFTILDECAEQGCMVMR